MNEKVTRLGLQPLGSTFRPPTSAYLARLETALGAELPAEYRSFLQQYGVCTVSDFVSFALPDGPRVDLNVFLGSDPDDSYDVGEVWRGLSDRLPSQYLPVALDTHGNAICLCMQSSGFGAIHYWDHETDDITLVSSSFPAFITILRREPA